MISKTARAINILDVDPEALTKMIVAVQRLARGIAAALNPDGLRVVQFNGAPAGQSVFHLHFHVIPVWQGQAQAGHGAGTADPGELQAMARQIAAKLA